MDLADLSSLSKYDKYKYLLNVIDIFSGYAWSILLNKRLVTQSRQLSNLYFNIENQLQYNHTRALNLLTKLSSGI